MTGDYGEIDRAALCYLRSCAFPRAAREATQKLQSSWIAKRLEDIRVEQLIELRAATCGLLWGLGNQFAYLRHSASIIPAPARGQGRAVNHLLSFYGVGGQPTKATMYTANRPGPRVHNNSNICLTLYLGTGCRVYDIKAKWTSKLTLLLLGNLRKPRQ